VKVTESHNRSATTSFIVGRFSSSRHRLRPVDTSRCTEHDTSHTTVQCFYIITYLRIVNNMIRNKHIATAIRSWPASCSTFALYHRCCQQNGRRVLTTSSDGRTLLIARSLMRKSMTRLTRPFVLAVWLSGNALASINVVALR